MMRSFSGSGMKPVSSYQQLPKCPRECSWVRRSLTQHSLCHVHFDCNLSEVIIYTQQSPSLRTDSLFQSVQFCLFSKKLYTLGALEQTCLLNLVIFVKHCLNSFTCTREGTFSESRLVSSPPHRRVTSLRHVCGVSVTYNREQRCIVPQENIGYLQLQALPTSST